MLENIHLVQKNEKIEEEKKTHVPYKNQRAN